MKFSLGGMLKAFKNKRRKSLAMTIAELGVALGIAAVIIAAVIIGFNKDNYGNVKSIDDAPGMKLNYKIALTLAKMHANGELLGYTSQGAFFEKFKEQYQEVSKSAIEPLFIVDDSSDDNQTKVRQERYTECFPEDGYSLIGEDDDEGAGQGVSGQEFRIGFKTSLGECVAFTYDAKSAEAALKDADISKNEDGKIAENSDKSILDRAILAVRGIYDINGTDSPNEMGKDAGILATFSQCNNVDLVSFGGKCKGDFKTPDRVKKCREHGLCDEKDVQDYCKDNPTDRYCICNITNPKSLYCLGDVCKPYFEDDELCNSDSTHPCCFQPPVPSCCTLTAATCNDDNGKVVDLANCQCECKKSPTMKNENGIELTLDTKSCLYECPYAKDYSKLDPKVVNIEESQKPENCTCVMQEEYKDLKKNCKGTWNDRTCSCDCSPELEDKCKKDSCGYAELNESCQCTCKKSLWESNLEASAKKDNLTKEQALKNTNFSSDFDKNKCFTCATGNAQIALRRGQCACVAGCNNEPTPADIERYKYFNYTGFDPDPKKACKWTCDTEKLKALVKELNEQGAGDALRPFAMNKYAKTDDLAIVMNSKGKEFLMDSHYNDKTKLNDFRDFKTANTGKYGTENMGQAQNLYNVAAILGKMSLGGVNENNDLHRALRCNEDDCEVAYKKLNGNFNDLKRDSVGRFYRFLMYFNTAEKEPAFGYNGQGIRGYMPEYFNLKEKDFLGDADKLKEAFMLKYVADTARCTVKLEDFNYGLPPIYKMSLHGAGEKNKSNAAKHSFGFTAVLNGIKNGNEVKLWKVENPNMHKIENLKITSPTPIERPKEFAAYDGKNYNAHTDKTFGEKCVGVIIQHVVFYDPLALNMSIGAPKADPAFSSTVTLANLHYGDDKKYHAVRVNWPKENYQFLVHKNYAKENTAAYMFSDVYTTWMGDQFRTGFDQLKKLDTNNDGLITDKELVDLRLISKPQVGESDLISLTDKVFEINTSYRVRMDQTGRGLQNMSAVFENNGEFRRLIKVDDVASLCAGKTCLVYEKQVNEKGKPAREQWALYTNNQEKFELQPTGGQLNSLYRFIWSSTSIPKDAILLHKINGVYYREIIARVSDIVFKSQQ